MGEFNIKMKGKSSAPSPVWRTGIGVLQLLTHRVMVSPCVGGDSVCNCPLVLQVWLVLHVCVQETSMR